MSGGEPSSIKRHFRVCRGQPAGAAMGLMTEWYDRADSRFFNLSLCAFSLREKVARRARRGDWERVPIARKEATYGTASCIIPQMAPPDL